MNVKVGECFSIVENKDTIYLIESITEDYFEVKIINRCNGYSLVKTKGLPTHEFNKDKDVDINNFLKIEKLISLNNLACSNIIKNAKFTKTGKTFLFKREDYNLLFNEETGEEIFVNSETATIANSKGHRVLVGYSSHISIKDYKKLKKEIQRTAKLIDNNIWPL